jgi:hypothetical protein
MAQPVWLSQCRVDCTRGEVLRFRAGTRDFSPYPRIQTGSVLHRVHYSVGTGALYPRIKQSALEADPVSRFRAITFTVLYIWLSWNLITGTALSSTCSLNTTRQLSLRTIAFMEFVHRPELWILENNVSETGSVSVITWGSTWRLRHIQFPKRCVF